MRDRKCRVWDGKDMLWFDDPREWDIEDYEQFIVATRKPGAVVMDVTSLQDKKGGDIYQGDIEWIRFGFPSQSMNMAVFWHRRDWRLGSLKNCPCGCGKRIPASNHITNISSFEEGEVIGNIYENPELLK